MQWQGGSQDTRHIHNLMYLSQPLLLPLSCRPPLLPSSDPLSLAVSLSLASLYILPSPLVSSSPIVSLSLTGPLCLLSLSLYVSPPLSHPISLTLTTALLLLFSLNLTLSPPLLNKMSYSPCPFHVVSTEMAPFSPSILNIDFLLPLHLRFQRNGTVLTSSAPSYVVSNETGPFSLPSHVISNNTRPFSPLSSILCRFQQNGAILALSPLRFHMLALSAMLKGALPIL